MTNTDHAGIDPTGALRVDRWLWVARFFKTRSAAAEAVAGGKIHVDGERVKPSRRVQAGERLAIRRGLVEWEVVVVAVAARRGPPAEATRLYEESAASVERRAVEAEQRRQAETRRERGLGRPSKRDRRDIDRLRGRDG